MASPQDRHFRTAYKVEELLALRDSVSESAVSLDKFPAEDAIKVHVLRPTSSAYGLTAPAAEAQSQTSSSASSVSDKKLNVVASSVPSALKKPSPSPSFKRDKAEKLLKAHGSPPGVRVTAGGRIVPADNSLIIPSPSHNDSHSPLFHGRRPHASYSSFKSSDPSLHNTWLNPYQQIPVNSYPVNLPDGYVFLAPDGRLHQCVNRTSFALNRNPLDGRPLFIAPPINFPFVPVDPMAFDNTVPEDFPQLTTAVSENSLHSRLQLGSSAGAPPIRRPMNFDPAIMEVAALPLDKDGKRSIVHELVLVENVQLRYNQQLRQVDQEIVLARDKSLDKEHLVGERKELVRFLNDCRVTQKKLNEEKKNGTTEVIPTEISVHIFSANHNSVNQPAHDKSPENGSPTQPVKSNLNVVPRRNRPYAVPIRAPPPDNTNTLTGRTLNPASPAWEPSAPIPSAGISQPVSPFVPPTPSAPASPLQVSEALREKLPAHLKEPSSSSVDTSDFFPNNPAQHSLHRGNELAPQDSTESGRKSKEISVLNEATINDLETKSQQYMLGFLVGLSGQSSNMTKPSDWLQGYCNGLQRRLCGSDSEDTHLEHVESTLRETPAALPTPPPMLYDVQQPISNTGSGHGENTRANSMHWPNGTTTLDTIRSGQVPLFPVDGSLARSGPMGHFQMPSKTSSSALRQISGPALTGYSGNRVTSQQVRRDSSTGVSDFQVSRNAQSSGSRDSAARVDSSDDGAHGGSTHRPVLMSVPLDSHRLNGVVAPASSPARSARTAESPKRSPGKRLDHITRHFRTNTNNSSEVQYPEKYNYEGSPSALELAQAVELNARRGWRNGFGRRFSRKDVREDESSNTRRLSTYVPTIASPRVKL